MKTKLLSLIAGTAISAIAASATVATPASANQISLNDATPKAQQVFNLNLRRCGFLGRRVGKHAVRHHAFWSGYGIIYKVRFVPRWNNGFNRRCGYYRSIAFKFGQRYVLFSSARTGRILTARRIGPNVGAPGFVASKFTVRKKLRNRGYAVIRNIRLVRNFNRRYYVSTAWKFGHKYRIYSNARTGRPYSRVRVI